MVPSRGSNGSSTSTNAPGASWTSSGLQLPRVPPAPPRPMLTGQAGYHHPVPGPPHPHGPPVAHHHPHYAQQYSSHASHASGLSSMRTGVSEANGSSKKVSSKQLDWQSDADMALRRKMMQHIVQLLKKHYSPRTKREVIQREAERSGKNITDAEIEERMKQQEKNWNLKLPAMTKKLEIHLYTNAKSRTEYQDLDTLKERLTAIAGDVSDKTEHMRNRAAAAASSSSQNMSQHHSQELVDRDARHRQQRLYFLHHSSRCQAPRGQCRKSQYCDVFKDVWEHLATCKYAGEAGSRDQKQCTFAHCHSSRMILSHYKSCKDERCVVCAPVRRKIKEQHNDSSRSQHRPASQQLTNRAPPPQASSKQERFNITEGMMHSPPKSTPTPTQPQHHPYYSSYPPQSALSHQSTGSIHESSSERNHRSNGQYYTNGNHMIPSSQYCLPASENGRPQQKPIDDRLLAKRRRLLLLRHAYKCTDEICQIPDCSYFRGLWNHLSKCDNPRCPVKSCVSSRHMLSHYKACPKDGKCEVCSVVRSFSPEEQKKVLLTADITTIPPPVISSAKRKMEQPESADSNHLHKIARAESSSFRNGFNFSQNLSHPPSSQQSFGHLVQSPIDSSKYSEARNLPEKKKEMQRQYSVSSDGTSTAKEKSLLESMTSSQIKDHIQSLITETKGKKYPSVSKAKLRELAAPLMTKLRADQNAWIFNEPVDPVQWNLPDYFDIIKKPMDFSTIVNKVNEDKYESLPTFRADVELVFSNAMLYNQEGSDVHKIAKEMNDQFLVDWNKTVPKEFCTDVNNGDDNECNLCKCGKRTFEDPVYFCFEPSCGKPLKRGTSFYSAQNQYYCNTCYNNLPSTVKIVDSSVDATARPSSIKKSEFQKRKHEDPPVEPWVECDSCKNWVHQICGLFNKRENTDNSEYNCPQCVLEKHSKQQEAHQKSSTDGLQSAKRAEDLPRTRLSDALQESIDSVLLNEKDGDADVSPIIVRQVTSQDESTIVRTLMAERYKNRNYPVEFPHKSKCLLLFQQIDGVDVLLFALYVYEYGAECPAPNNNCVYISYLDSVRFLRPSHLRTKIYHEILISYLDYTRKKGFTTAHIWACPPVKGDDYIFYAKPKDQKIPKTPRLCKWYQDMLVKAQDRGVVRETCNIYDLYFAKDSPKDPTLVPYFSGDYFEGEVEMIIDSLNQSKEKSIKSKKRTSNNSRAIDFDDPSVVDPVIEKLGEKINPIKDTLMVAYLNTESSNIDGNSDVPEQRKTLKRENSVQTDSKEDTAIDDDKEVFDCEIFNSRQALLNLCKGGNHYQFDELRRSKHTSMMLLWHLHNRDAPKFVHQCSNCYNDMLSGYRYHCPTCTDYDLCQTCYSDSSVERTCQHKLERIAVGNQEGKSQMAQRREQQRTLQMHIRLLEHASRCLPTSDCPSRNCKKMKAYLEEFHRHRQGQTCNKCKICKRIGIMLSIHAQRCKQTACSVPGCASIKERIRRLRKQQQAMDDRRRMEMNRLYREQQSHPGDSHVG